MTVEAVGASVYVGNDGAGGPCYGNACGHVSRAVGVDYDGVESAGC